MFGRLIIILRLVDGWDDESVSARPSRSFLDSPDELPLAFIWILKLKHDEEHKDAQ